MRFNSSENLRCLLRCRLMMILFSVKETFSWFTLTLQFCFCLRHVRTNSDTQIAFKSHLIHNEVVFAMILSFDATWLPFKNNPRLNLIWKQFSLSEPFDKKRKRHAHEYRQRHGILRHCLPASCVHFDADLDGTNAEESLTSVELAAHAAHRLDVQVAYHSQGSINSERLFTEQSQSTVPVTSSADAQSANGTGRDCLQPYRFPRCKFHHKKNRHRTSIPQPPLERVDNDIEHSIVVVADVPVDNFEKMLEDVV